MNTEQRAAAEEALRRYGAHLTPDGFITRGDKVLGVRIEIAKGRIRMVSRTGDLLASFPAKNITGGVSSFVEKFWYWTPVSANRRMTRGTRRR